VGIAGTFAQFVRLGQRKAAGDHRAAPWLLRHGEGTADRARPIIHRMQPDPVMIANIFGQANTIVPDVQPSCRGK
jgi:hypothetical protein